MNTLIVSKNQLDEMKSQALIRNAIMNDELVVFPTETVYGIGANALSPAAVKKIFQVKGRPADNPLIVHLYEPEATFNYIVNPPRYTQQLMDAFWPGPLTLVFQSNGTFPKEVTGGLSTIAIRVPAHPVARKVIAICDVPICAPSANISGRPSSTRFAHVKEDFDGKVAILIDGGATHIGLESTVLDLTTQTPAILRPGQITQEMIEHVLSMPIDNASEKPIEGSPKSPGMKYKHYAPKGNLTLVNGDMESVIAFFNHKLQDEGNEKTAILCPDEYAISLKKQAVFRMGSLQRPETIAEQLFKLLRLMDEKGYTDIYIPVIQGQGLEVAIMNRLLKAANHHVIDLSSKMFEHL